MKISILSAMACLMLAAMLLPGCETMSTIPIPGLDAKAPRPSIPYDAMPLEAAAITSAVAIQTLASPLESAGNVRFAPGAHGVSETLLALEGFEFTGAAMQTFRPADAGGSGLVGGTLTYSCPLDRRAEFLFVAEYDSEGEGYLIKTLKVAPKYSTAPRVKVFVLRHQDLPDKSRVVTYTDLVALLAHKALSPGFLGKALEGSEVALVAVGQDRMDPSVSMGLVVSDTSIGTGGYGQGAKSYSFNGWPVAVYSGFMDLARVESDLYAKVLIVQAGLAGMNRTALLCVHPLTSSPE